MKTFRQHLLEMPQYYPGAVSYQKDAKFVPVSVRNANTYTVIHQDPEFTYTVDSALTTGFIFETKDMTSKEQHILPVLRVSLRDSGIENLKQAHFLRIRANFSEKGLATTWYLSYVNHVGGVVSDAEHLTGGKVLWQSFIKTAEKDSGLDIKLHDKNNGVETDVTSKTPEDEIWSTGNDSKKNLVLVLRKK